MDDTERTNFAAAHHADAPLILYNIWDAGSAQAVARAGAKAIATGSNPVAGANGFADGECFPIDRVLDVARSIVAAVDLPVSIDFEGGYSADPGGLAINAQRLAETGAVGCNFEDQIIGGEGLHETSVQAERIKAVVSSGLFVNARTDLFLSRWKAGENPNRNELIDQAIDRAAAYAEAGAECFFAPGLSDPAMIARLCENISLPVNLIKFPEVPSPAELGKLGVARVSWGGAPWKALIDQLEQNAAALFASV